MSFQEDMVGAERELADGLAQHVEGPVLLAALVQIGGTTDYVAWLRRRIYGGERGLPRSASIAVTPSDVYIFEPGKPGKPVSELARWPRATLRATEVKQFGARARLFLTLPSGKNAIIVFRGDGSSGAVRDRVRRLFGEETGEVAAPELLGSPSEPAMVSQSEEFSRVREGMLASAYPVFESDETVRFRVTEMAPAPLILGPLLLFYGFFWPLFRLARGPRALVATERNLYLIRGRGADASVLYKTPLGSARIDPVGNIARGRHLQIGDQSFWMLGPPDEVGAGIAAAKAGDSVGMTPAESAADRQRLST